MKRWIKQQVADAGSTVMAGISGRSASGPVPAFEISGDWSLFPGSLMSGGTVEVVGEHFRQDAFDRFAGPKTTEGPTLTMVMAQLAPEPKNSHDRNAVAVFVGAEHVGYVSRGMAPNFLPVVNELISMGRAATCHAEVTGGWNDGRGDEGDYGLVLDIALPPRIRTVADPVFASGRGRINLTGEEHCQDFLRQRLGRAKKHLFTATLELDGEIVVARYDEMVVGTLTKKMSERYLPILQHLELAGWPTTCEGAIRPGQTKLEVTLDLPQGQALNYAMLEIGQS